MNSCTICSRPIRLVPSAQERADKYGTHPARYYTALFTEHADCTLRRRAQETQALMRRITGEKA